MLSFLFSHSLQKKEGDKKKVRKLEECESQQEHTMVKSYLVY